MIATYALLTLALLALWVGVDASRAWMRFAWFGLWMASACTALAGGLAEPVAFVWLGALAGAAWTFGRRAASKSVRVTAAIAVVILAGGLMTHQLPGFNNPRVIATTLTSSAIPYRLHLNFDKASVGLLLLGFCHARIADAAGWRTLIVRAAPVVVGTITLIIVAALALGYVRFEPKFPPVAAQWLWANLFLTCLAEEAVFRGFIQAGLQRVFADRRGGDWAALVMAAGLFGLAHSGGGVAYVGLSALAGIGYGYAYLRSGNRIEASILTHFALNAVHFLGFTYPALARA